jgi:hypothetical protein
MNINTIIVAALTVLIHFVRVDHRSVRDMVLLLEEVVDTSYFISFSLPIPLVPLTIDPSPPVLAPPFDPTNIPSTAHTHSSATSTDPSVVSRSIDLMVCLVLVVISGILLCVSLPFSVESPLRPLVTIASSLRER